MAKSYLEELFEKAKRAAQGAASKVQQSVAAIPQNLRNLNEVTADERNAGRNFLIRQGFKPNAPAATESIKITDAIRNTSGNVAKSFGDMYRRGFVNPMTGKPADSINNRIRPVLNMTANTAETIGSGASGATMNLMDFFQKPSVSNAVRQGAGLAYNWAKVASAGMPIFQGANAASQLPQNGAFGFVPRVATGFQRGMTGVDSLAPEVKEQKMKVLGMEFDPVVEAGKMIGFVKNPVNAKLFGATEGIKLAPFAEKIAGNPGAQRILAKVGNFITTNSIRGGIEDIMMSLDELPENASIEEQAKYLAKNGLLGALSENVGRAFLDGSEAGMRQGANLIQGKLDSADFRPVVEFLEDLNLLRRETGTAKASTTTRRGPRTAEEIIRDAQGRFSTTPAEPVKQPKVGWAENPENPNQLLRTEDGVFPQKPAPEPSTARFIQDPNQPSRYVRDGRQLQSMNSVVGLGAGIEIERDENGKPTGKVKFNTNNALGGMFAVGALQNRKAIGEYGESVAKNFAERAAKGADEVIDNPQTGEEFINNARAAIKSLPEAPKVTWKEAADRFYTDWVNRFHPIEQAAGAVEKSLKEQGAELLPSANPKFTLRRFMGIGGIAENRFNNEVKPILETMDKQGIDKLDMDAYLKARRDINLGERGVFGSDPVQAQSTVQAFEAKYGPKIGEVAQQFYDYQTKLFDELAEAGFIKPDVAERIKAANADYVPFQRVMDDNEVDEFLGIPTKKVQQGTNPINKMKGSERDIYSPIESIIANTYKLTSAIEKNKTTRSITELQNVLPELGFEPAPKSSDSTITVWVDGAKQYIEVGREIAAAVKGLNEESMNGFLKLFTGPAALLRQGATGRNPEFMIPNIIRDQFDAGINSNYGYIPVVDYIRGLAHIIRKDVTGSDEVVDAWMKSGASQQLSSMTGRSSIKEMFDKKTGRKGLFGWLSSGLDVMGKYSEEPTRVGLFDKARNKTGNDFLAMMESREGTMDFSRMGAKMKVANSVIPFLNVGVQGFDKTIRNLKDKPAKTLFLMTLYGVLPQVASTSYNLINFPEEYAEIPQFEKDGNFIFISGRNKDGTINYAAIPKGNVTTLVANPVENFMSYMAGTNKQDFGQFATQMISSTLPVIGDGSDLTEVGIKTIGSNLPQTIKPIAENLLNKSFFRYNSKDQAAKEIVPYWMQKKAPGDQSYDYTPDAYKVIGKVLNVSPLQIQNLAEGYLAGYAKVPVQIINLLTKAADGEEITRNEITLARRFLKTTYPNSESQQAAKKQAKETPLIPQAGATDGSFPQKSPVIPKSGENLSAPAEEDRRNWLQKLFNITPKDDSEPTAPDLPEDIESLTTLYKDAQSVISGYNEKKTKYQYGRYDEETDIDSKLEELEADKAWAEDLKKRIEEKYPEKVIDMEISTYKSNGGRNVQERAEWAYNTIKKLGETGDTDKMTALLDKLWDEKVLTGGKEGVAQKILEEYGLNVFTYGKDAKSSKDPNAKGSGTSKLKKEIKKEQEKAWNEFFKGIGQQPKIAGFKAPQSQVNWQAPATAASSAAPEDASFQTKVPSVTPTSLSQFFQPKVTGVSPLAQEAVNDVRGGGRKDDRLTLRYAGGRSR